MRLTPPGLLPSQATNGGLAAQQRLLGSAYLTAPPSWSCPLTPLHHTSQ